MAGIPLRTWLDLNAPTWGSRYWGSRFLGGAIGVMADLIGQGATIAMKASWLLQSVSPNDALIPIGIERSMHRYDAESDVTYRRRLHGAWDAWLFAGTVEGEGDQGITGQYTAAGYPNVRILNNFEWDFENPKDTANWSRFVVVIEQSHPFTSWTYGSGPSYGSGVTFGSTATLEQVEEIRSIALKWKEGHAINPWIYVILDHEYYGDPDMIYGAAGVVYGGETIRWAN